MTNNEDKNNKEEEGIDLSQFPFGVKKEKKEEIEETLEKRSAFKTITKSLSPTNRKEKIYISIIVISLITTIIILFLVFGGQKQEETPVITPEDCPPEICPPDIIPPSQ